MGNGRGTIQAGRFQEAMLVEPVAGKGFRQLQQPIRAAFRGKTDIPNMCRVVPASGDNAFAVRAELGEKQLTVMFQGIAQGLAGSGIPHASGSVVGSRDNALAVRTE